MTRQADSLPRTGGRTPYLAGVLIEELDRGGITEWER